MPPTLNTGFGRRPAVIRFASARVTPARVAINVRFWSSASAMAASTVRRVAASGRVDLAKTIEGVTNDATTSRPLPTNRTDDACCSRRAGGVGRRNRRDLSHGSRRVGAFYQHRLVTVRHSAWTGVFPLLRVHRSRYRDGKDGTRFSATSVEKDAKETRCHRAGRTRRLWSTRAAALRSRRSSAQSKRLLCLPLRPSRLARRGSRVERPGAVAEAGWTVRQPRELAESDPQR